MPPTIARTGCQTASVWTKTETSTALAPAAWIISPEGKHLGTIKVPETVSNVAWGDKDGKTLYITASTSVNRIKLRVSGVKP